MLNVVLFQPEIPANTGTIGRSCVLTDTRLHLIGPLGFSLDDRMVRRSGMGYWHDIDLVVYDNYAEFLGKNPDARPWMFTKRADAYYHEVSYADGDYLMFGRESVGIDADVLAAHPERCLRIPMLEREGLSPATTQGPLSDRQTRTPSRSTSRTPPTSCCSRPCASLAFPALSRSFAPVDHLCARSPVLPSSNALH